MAAHAPHHPVLIADTSRGPPFEAVADALRRREPHLDLDAPGRRGRLYEPDGTLYAVVLSEQSTLRTDRRSVEVLRGDALIIPQGIAIDIDGEIDVFGIRHEGTPPHHFRERFLQVWGFEHQPAPIRTAHAEDVAVLAGPEHHHRIDYHIVERLGEGLGPKRSTGEHWLLVLALDGQAKLAVDGDLIELSSGGLAYLESGREYQIGGNGRVGLISAAAEPAFVVSQQNPRSPEYRPRRSEPL